MASVLLIGMMSLVSRFEALFLFVLVCLGILIIDARAVDEKSQKQDHLLDIIEEKIIKKITRRTLSTLSRSTRKSCFH